MGSAAGRVSFHLCLTSVLRKTSCKTSFTSSTYTKRIPLLTLKGTFSSMLALFAPGATMVVIPARCAARIFSLKPPTGSTCPTNDISPVIAGESSINVELIHTGTSRLTDVRVYLSFGEEGDKCRDQCSTRAWPFLTDATFRHMYMYIAIVEELRIDLFCNA